MRPLTPGSGARWRRPRPSSGWSTRPRPRGSGTMPMPSGRPSMRGAKPWAGLPTRNWKSTTALWNASRAIEDPESRTMTDKFPLHCPVCPHPQPILGTRCPQCNTNLEPLRRVRELPGQLAREGLRLQQTGAGSEGLALLTAAAVLTPDPVDSRLALARVLLEQRRYGQAREVLTPLLAREPETPEARRLQQLCRDGEETRKAEREQAERSQAERGRALRRRWLCLSVASTALGGLLVFFITWAGLRPPPVHPPPASAVSITTATFTDPRVAKAKTAVAAAFPMIRMEESGPGLRLSGEVQSYRELAELLRAAQEAVGMASEDIKVKYDSFFFYRIRSGDSLTLLAQRFYGRPGLYKVIQAANPARVKDANLLHPGDLLMIPGTADAGP
ncbi:MAG: hypothetical protein C4567_14485 [Deltaproteobacteria bacterium]|nr:MAG: hypothetical protein C4567_14485 [Deltaproteobacteria bacterium]